MIQGEPGLTHETAEVSHLSIFPNLFQQEVQANNAIHLKLRNCLLVHHFIILENTRTSESGPSFSEMHEE